MLDLQHFLISQAFWESQEQADYVVTQFSSYVEICNSKSYEDAYISLDKELRKVVRFILQPEILQLNNLGMFKQLILTFFRNSIKPKNLDIARNPSMLSAR